MRRIILLPAISFCLLILTKGILSAQSDTSKLAFNQVEVVKAFEIKLRETEPVENIPSLVTPDLSLPRYAYTITPVPVDIQYPKPELRALAMQPDDPIDIKKAFLKGGYGNRVSPCGEAAWHTARKDIYRWGAHGKYFSADDQERFLNHKMTNVDLDVFGSYVWKNNLQLEGQFTNNYRSRYLWNQNMPEDSLVIQRNINQVDAKVGLSNIDLSPFKLNYRSEVGFQNTRVSDQGIFEQSLYVQGEVEKHRTERLAFVINLRLETTVYKAENWESLWNALSSPHFILRIGKFRSLLGVSAILSNKNSAIFPKIDLSYPVWQDHIQVFVGSDMKNYNNTMFNLTDVNPFMNTRVDSLQNTISREIFGGVKGEYSFISYQFTGGYKLVNNHFQFFMDSTDIRRHRVSYADGNMAFLSGNLDFKVRKNITVGGRLHGMWFKTDSTNYLLGIPNLTLNVYSKADFFENKLKLHAGLLFMDGYRFPDFDGRVQKENPLLDLEASVEYFPLSFLGMYVKGNNLLNSNFQRWQGYSQLGIQVSGGLIATF